MTAKPLISIVTPCLNRARYVREAIESVLAQNYPNFEHIIADGGSKDGTLEILREYPHLKVVSEPDKNLYDALNKGIRLAKGEIVGHLNTDDLYEPGIFGEVADLFMSGDSIDGVFGGSRIYYDAPEGKRASVEEHLSEDQVDLSFLRTVTGSISINAHFFRRSVYDRLAYFNLAYPIAADRDFLIRASQAGIREKFLNRCVYHYRLHESSITFNRAAYPVLKVGIDHLSIAEQLLERTDLTGEQRSVLKMWHSRNTCVLIMHSLRTRAWPGLWTHSIRGMKHNRLWPAEVVAAAAYLLTGQKERWLPSRKF
jgi:glycosyltransferase involved in cell wall biosynthesis